MSLTQGGRGRGHFRLVLFVDPRSGSSTTLLGAALRACAAGEDVDVLAVVDAAGHPPGRLRTPRTLGARLARRAFEPRGSLSVLDDLPALVTCRSLARRHGVAYLVPPERQVNHRAFVERLRAQLRPDATLALLVAQIFGPSLLAACSAPANYHNGLLPSYRGMGATAWSVYHGEPRSGFTYHRMSGGIDDGPVLVQDSVTVPEGSSLAVVERAKTRLAAERMGAALSLLVEGHPGWPQRGEASTFTRADLSAARAVGDPSTLTWEELERRVRAFELIVLQLAGERFEVTALRRIEGSAGHPRLAFTTADGVRAEPSRFVHLPLVLYRAYRALRKGPS